MQLGEFPGRLLESLMKAVLSLMKKVIKPLAKSLLIPLGLTAATLTADEGIHKKYRFGNHDIDNFKQKKWKIP